MDKETLAITLGIIFGFAARLRLLQSDYRQYPTYPHGQVIHLALGLIASALGAVAIPALLKPDYTAVTFLTLAAQQFRDVRNMERETLQKLDETELVPRGFSYIEGIAMVFEGRNYIVILAALFTSAAVMFGGWITGVVVGIVAIVLSSLLKSGKNMGQIGAVYEVPLRVEGASLYAADIYLMNIGLPDNRKRILENGVGIVIEPLNASSRITISNLGQRQAILHDVSSILGVTRDSGEPALTPLAKLDLKDGRLGLVTLPQEKNIPKIIQVIKNVPVLESAVRKPNQFDAKKQV
ncbi:YIEGIA family protein [Shimazuella alba]|uniref:YIEGIA family protein n=1 Tax=Shimazuella alba TaxID=2690964 RepID=UPI001F19F215|nr:YIEGIA family protein [Shimazuella alba]